MLLQVKVLVTLGSRTVNGRGHKGLLECRRVSLQIFQISSLYSLEKSY